jgi:hypothetical protein
MPHAEPSEMLVGFRQVVAYRAIIKHISHSANGTLVWGAIMSALWVMRYNRLPGQPAWNELPWYLYLHFALAASELVIGLWKKIAPSPFTFLLDAALLLGFAAVNGLYAYARYQRGIVDPISIGLAAYMLFLAYQQFQAWVQVNRALVYRPSREQLAKFDELVRDVRRADPEADPHALSLRTRPGWKALLLGDIAFFVASTSDVVVAHKEEVDLEIETDEGEANGPDGSRPAVLWLPGGQFGPFPLDPRNAANFVAWKADR